MPEIAPPTDRARQLAALVAGRVSALQAQLSPPGSQTAIAHLARLRRAVGRQAGSVPDVWELTMTGLHDGQGDAPPTPAETAVHIAMSLFALHQRGNGQPMHVTGVGLGRAVSRLRQPAADTETLSSDGVARRFGALATAVEITEIEYHLRGLVTMLAGASIGLDYGRLTADLYRVQNPLTADRARLTWARDFYQRQPADSLEANADPITETTKDGS